jgi:hypothetical protein
MRVAGVIAGMKSVSDDATGVGIEPCKVSVGAKSGSDAGAQWQRCRKKRRRRHFAGQRCRWKR